MFLQFLLKKIKVFCKSYFVQIYEVYTKEILPGLAGLSMGGVYYSLKCDERRRQRYGNYHSYSTLRPYGRIDCQNG